MNAVLETKNLEQQFVDAFRAVEPFCLRNRNGGWTRTPDAIERYTSAAVGVYPFGYLSPNPLEDLFTENSKRGEPLSQPTENCIRYYFDNDGSLCAAKNEPLNYEISVYREGGRMVLICAKVGVPVYAYVCDYDEDGRIRYIQSCDVYSGAQMTTCSLDYQSDKILYRELKAKLCPNMNEKLKFLRADGSFCYNALNIEARKNDKITEIQTLPGMKDLHPGVTAFLTTMSFHLRDNICFRIDSRQESNLFDRIDEHEIKPCAERDALKHIYAPTLDFYPEFREAAPDPAPVKNRRCETKQPTHGNPLFEAAALEEAMVNRFRAVEPFCLRYRNGGWTRTPNASIGYATDSDGVFPLGGLSPIPVEDLFIGGVRRGKLSAQAEKQGVRLYFDKSGRLCAAYDDRLKQEICVYWENNRMAVISGERGIPQNAYLCDYDEAGRIREIIACEVRAGTMAARIELAYQTDEILYRALKIEIPPDFTHETAGFLNADGSFRYESLKVGARMNDWMQELLTIPEMDAGYPGVTAELMTMHFLLRGGVCVKIRSRTENNLTDRVSEGDLKPNVKRDAMKYVYMPTLDFYPELRN